jgi:hypothetical protein
MGFIYQSTQHHIPENQNPNPLCLENLKSHIQMKLLKQSNVLKSKFLGYACKPGNEIPE